MEIKLPPLLYLSPHLPVRQYVIALFTLVLLSNSLNAQEGNPYVSYDVPFQNLLKFNRFLINPTFSAVREDKSYINLFHRSQSADFENNAQNYFLSYSGRINDMVGLGFSLYNQQEGVISNLGVMANYSHGIRLGKESSLTFGVNIPYYVSNYDASRSTALQQDDPLLSDTPESSIISLQPGINLSLGKFDVGVFAQNLVDYNIKSGKSLTTLDQKTFSGHLQYTHTLENGRGIFEDGRLMPLARARFNGAEDPIFGGGVILDLPKLGWVQGGYDQFYGVSAGTGFNLNRRLSFGYNFEKNISNSIANLGVTHEISISYSFVPNMSKNVFIAEDGEEKLKSKSASETSVASTDGETDKNGKSDAESVASASLNADERAYLEGRISQLQQEQEDSYAVIDELLFRMDSLEQSREEDMEKRFEMVMRLVQRNNGDQIPDIEENAQKLYLADKEDLDSVYNSVQLRYSVAEQLNSKTAPKHKDLKTKGTYRGGAYKPIEKFISLNGVGQGHYIVANVFKNETYLKNFMEDLKSKGLQAQYFKNPENGLNYVYLAKYDEDDAAYDAYKSQMKGKYTDKLWIMHVENPRYSNWADTIFQDIE
ncbi:PorP/SprF family type IX secretion system membrane protein [Flagellimonas zhangzhouensis]|uniref:Type IX secretion system membrane protein, PorP/SprF family n=1 Tax=Flagellimonas zhangzhouensis TaxID=1073328 RepID=A0A1H2RJR3_9FLAO|nr:type IX secretion system membrane protein PorP/SprF [Allomuricauda zhangzhouensis]SDQ64800.1 type IX secretion system membrane protein, PorP/SprF family [Allomuricauda zhangzhouensis]SDW19723.1 type IX secretion system membrane protein, PorP/SprF family [Allomuricauda zhangzhouensis]